MSADLLARTRPSGVSVPGIQCGNGGCVFEYRQRQIIENNGFRPYRHRLAYGSQFWDTHPKRRTLTETGLVNNHLIDAVFAAPIRVSSAFILVRNVPIPPTLAADMRFNSRYTCLIRAANLFHIAMLFPGIADQNHHFKPSRRLRVLLWRSILRPAFDFFQQSVKLNDL